jgi:hypothetical protein
MWRRNLLVAQLSCSDAGLTNVASSAQPLASVAARERPQGGSELMSDLQAARRTPPLYGETVWSRHPLRPPIFEGEGDHASSAIRAAKARRHVLHEAQCVGGDGPPVSGWGTRIPN